MQIGLRMNQKKIFLFQSMTGVSANTLITIFSQIFFPVLVLNQFGMLGFKLWVVANSSAALVSLGELGIGSLLSVECEKLGDARGSVAVAAFYKKIRLLFFNWMNIFAFLVVLLLVLFHYFFSQRDESNKELIIVTTLLSISNLIYARYSIGISGLRIRKKFAYSQAFLAMSRSTETVLVILSLLFAHSLQVTAFALFLNRFFTMLLLNRKVNQLWPELLTNSERDDFGLQSLRKPIIGNFFITSANWLRQQGPQFIGAQLLSLDTFVIFSLLRTFASGLRQIGDTVYSAFSPHLSAEILRRDGESLKQTIRWLLISVVFVEVAYLSISIVFGKEIISAWLHKTIYFSSLDFFFIVLATGLDVLVIFPLAILMSANKHFNYSSAFCLGSGLSLIASAFLSFSNGLTGFACGLFVLNILVLPYGIYLLIKFVKSVSDY